MAYRFLLEVPESLADEAGAAVGAAGDAQIVVRRSKSHSLAYDDPYVDMTAAAHSLDVVQTLFNWFESYRPGTPEIGIVLHSGERLRLKDHSRESLIAAIRRDQPWVERTAPRIGDHEEDYGSTGTVATIRSSRPVSAVLEPATALVEAPAKAITIRALNHIALRVQNLRAAEEFYTDLFEMDVLGRTLLVGGEQEAVSRGFSWASAGDGGADISYLQNGPLVLALHRVGLGARLERSLLEHISLRVDASTFTRIKGQVLMRGYEIVGQTETDFAFRDPNNVVWDLDLAGNPVFSNPFS
jgi:catechol 2,3-dioxygenase-like lactoylglutathione lyase family enzyme